MYVHRPISGAALQSCPCRRLGGGGPVGAGKVKVTGRKGTWLCLEDSGGFQEIRKMVRVVLSHGHHLRKGEEEEFL